MSDQETTSSGAWRWIAYPLLALLSLIAVAAALGGIVLILAYPNLPSLEVLTDYRPKVPLRVYTADGHMIGEFGEERRAVVRIKDVPPVMKQAILAAEDERFYQHGGIDLINGSPLLRQWVDDPAASVADFEGLVAADEAEWCAARQPFLRYPAA